MLLLLCRYMRWLPAGMDEARMRRLAKHKLHWAAVDEHVLAVSMACVTQPPEAREWLLRLTWLLGSAPLCCMCLQ